MALLENRSGCIKESFIIKILSIWFTFFLKGGYSFYKFQIRKYYPSWGIIFMNNTSESKLKCWVSTILPESSSKTLPSTMIPNVDNPSQFRPKNLEDICESPTGFRLKPPFRFQVQKDREISQFWEISKVIFINFLSYAIIILAA